MSADDWQGEQTRFLIAIQHMLVAGTIEEARRWADEVVRTAQDVAISGVMGRDIAAQRAAYEVPPLRFMVPADAHTEVVQPVPLWIADYEPARFAKSEPILAEGVPVPDAPRPKRGSIEALHAVLAERSPVPPGEPDWDPCDVEPLVLRGDVTITPFVAPVTLPADAAAADGIDLAKQLLVDGMAQLNREAWDVPRIAKEPPRHAFGTPLALDPEDGTLCADCRAPRNVTHSALCSVRAGATPGRIKRDL